MADSNKRYQVVAAAVLVPVKTDDGVMMYSLYRGMTFEGDPNNERIRHNVDSEYIVEVDAKAVAGWDGSGTPLVDDKPTVGDGNPGDPVELNDPGRTNDVEHRKAADALDADTPARRAGRPSNADKKALVDQAVKAGMDRGEAEKASVAELRAALSKS